jgi:hypothetical protein
MNENTTLEILYIFGGFSFLAWGIAILLLGQITVRHIEHEMKKEGILPPEWDKGIGIRYPAYASIIMRPNAKRHASTVDIEATKRFSRRIDWYLAVFVQLSTAIFFTIMFTAYYLYGPED